MSICDITGRQITFAQISAKAISARGVHECKRGGGGVWQDLFDGTVGTNLSAHTADTGQTYISKENSTRVLELDGSGGLWLDATSTDWAIVLVDGISYAEGDVYEMPLTNMTGTGFSNSIQTEMALWFNVTGTSATKTGVQVRVVRFQDNWTINVYRIVSNSFTLHATYTLQTGGGALADGTLKIVILGSNTADIYWNDVAVINEVSLVGAGITNDGSVGIGAICQTGRDRIIAESITLTR